MTITDKCEICRQRKVKCDQQKPTCSACRKGNRLCTYSFGRISAFVVEDPTKFSKHGKPKAAPLVYPLGQFHDGRPNLTEHSSEADFQTVTERAPNHRHGAFRTLALVSRGRANAIRRYPSAQQKKRLEIHLEHLKTSALMTYRPSSHTMILANRYISLLNVSPPEHQPFAILGSWILSIPSRIGSSAHVDLAVEYLADSMNFYKEGNFSNRRTALTSKAKALKELQIAVDKEKSRATYDTILAMKIHFAAEVLMGINNFYHVIHATALAEILRKGPPAGLDKEHYWDFLDNTYIDDVTEATVAGRVSVYDNEFYLNTTCPSSIPADTSLNFRASASIMHIFIQIPRLICLTRYAIDHPNDTTSLVSAISLAESLWLLDPCNLIEQLMHDSAITVPTPPFNDIADIVPDSYRFTSVASVILASRYWHLCITLCGVTEMLHARFPGYTENSLLPVLATVNKKDIDAAINLARCVRYPLDTCPSLPLLPLRIHNTFMISISSWYRLTRRLECQQDALKNDSEAPTVNIAEQLSGSQRMEKWVTEECNRMNELWHVEPARKKFLTAVVENMCGGPIPDWLPTRVRFECEDGNMVMKFDYGIEEEWIKSPKTRISSPCDGNKDDCEATYDPKTAYLW
ncbi:hypothetical protein P280DRAFT_465833 [Massarina eburnea CBS 473.64]|uniref:Zn(2)-C6 fungal-type domain-containing protein n=1 Tax=Massarina eburnea CBS 473.64 TaxID=1395130 RepID=A0A6A6SB85_9PLEO|nr:hypothetical protein P280DRAFT_465833 [Massarina eburnea CBS 473.64]